MNRHTLSRRLHIILIGIALCGLLFYLILLPWLLRRTLPQNPLTIWAHLIPLWISAIPCYAVLVYGWRIVRNIADDRSFCHENAAHLRTVSTLATIDAAWILLADLLWLLLGLAEGLMLLLSLIIIFIGVAVAVSAAALSHLVLRAAELQEQSDLTI